MKDFHLKILAIIMIIFGIFGLSTLPFLSIIVQYIDSITGFSSGNGYLTNNMDYLFKSPLIYIGGFFTANIITLLIPAFCKFLELWNDQIITSRLSAFNDCAPTAFSISCCCAASGPIWRSIKAPLFSSWLNVCVMSDGS